MSEHPWTLEGRDLKSQPEPEVCQWAEILEMTSLKLGSICNLDLNVVPWAQGQIWWKEGPAVRTLPWYPEDLGSILCAATGYLCDRVKSLSLPIPQFPFCKWR